jgi:4a-hydroxytetrahydrobiopterin dehydratase
MRPSDTITKLNTESVRGWLSDRRGWKRRSNKLTKAFRFPHFRDSIVFVNRVATLADTHKHHPEIDVRDGTVTLTLSTEDVGGISTRDLVLAEQIDFATSSGNHVSD